MLVSEELRQCCDGSDTAASYAWAVFHGVLVRIRHSATFMELQAVFSTSEKHAYLEARLLNNTRLRKLCALHSPWATLVGSIWCLPNPFSPDNLLTNEGVVPQTFSHVYNGAAHSMRKARTGSIEAARRAGMMPEMAAASTSTPIAMIITGTFTLVMS